MKHYLFLLIAALAGALAGYRPGIRCIRIETRETVRIDTLFYERPTPIRPPATTVVTVRVPRLVFGPIAVVAKPAAGATGEIGTVDSAACLADSVQLRIAVEQKHIRLASADTCRKTTAISVTDDSVQLRIAVEQKLFGDSTYRAQVSGPCIGEFGPSLDWIEIYNRTTDRVQSVLPPQSVSRRSRFAVTAGIGAAYTPAGFQPYMGVGVGMILWQW